MVLVNSSPQAGNLIFKAVILASKKA